MMPRHGLATLGPPDPHLPLPALRARGLAHRECAGLRDTDVQQPAVDGYRLAVNCGCGVEFRRWVTLDEMDENLIRTALLAFEN